MPNEQLGRMPAASLQAGHVGNRAAAAFHAALAGRTKTPTPTPAGPRQFARGGDHGADWCIICYCSTGHRAISFVTV